MPKLNAKGLSLDNPHDLGNPPSRLPLWLQRGMVIAFVVIVIASGLFALTAHWRRATFALGVGMMWLAVLRLTCDSQVIGLFAVRSRRFDVTFCTLLGATMAYLAASVDALGS